MTSATSDVRIRFRSPASTEGFIDGAWWPHSHELSSELPPVLTDFAASGHTVARVIYDLDSWTASNLRLKVGGGVAKLGGYRTDGPNVVSFIDRAGTRDRTDILVIDPDTDAAVAERILALASKSGSNLRAAEILAQATSS